jgi:chromate transport protein ChrA
MANFICIFMNERAFRLDFTLPSAIALIAFGYGVGALGDIAHLPWLHGLKIVAVAIVACTNHFEV